MSHTGGRFEKFDERARRVLSRAQEEAQRHNLPYIGAEHILLGLLRDSDCVASQVLKNLGVDLNEARRSVEDIIGGDEKPSIQIGLTLQAKRVIELAVGEVRSRGHSSINTGHLLMALLQEENGVAMHVLETLDISLENLRSELVRTLDQGQGAADED